MSPALHLAVLVARLDVSWSMALEALDDRSIEQATLGLANFPHELTVPRRRIMLLNSDGPAKRCAGCGQE